MLLHTCTEGAGALLLLPTHALSAYVLCHHPLLACTEHVGSVPPLPTHAASGRVLRPGRQRAPSWAGGRAAACPGTGGGREGTITPLLLPEASPRRGPAPGRLGSPRAAGAPRPAGRRRRRSHFPLAGPNPAPHPGEKGGGPEEEEGEEEPSCPMCGFARQTLGGTSNLPPHLDAPPCQNLDGLLPKIWMCPLQNLDVPPQIWM